ncbi:MAG TPA: winged helix-turn-helix domain-containing protein [Holophagaceae bacterium]|nr:winged helix-turn-helix domain-containing protein [Holophagaceae bacterium]
MPRQVFGPFTFDSRSGELRRGGLRIPLQDQPCAFLRMLTERPGKLVGRNELQRALWSDGTHVDFEDGLNAAAWRLRQALGDSSHHPVYIETVPRKGYRFLAEVLESPTQEVPALRPPPSGPGRRRGDLWQVRPGVLTAGLLALGLVGAATLASRRPGVPDARIHSLAVLPLHNLTAEENRIHLAEGLTEELTSELVKVRNLRVVPPGTSARYRNSGMPLAGIARELQVDALVEGSLVQDGSRYRLVVMLVRSGEWSQWAGTYESDLDGIHALMTRVASDLEGQLH